jgi:MOSC domain-containing protein YiiM
MILIDAVSTGRIVPISTRLGRSAIAKTPHEGPVLIARDGLTGDEVADTAAHGGLEQAVYCYCRADYDHFVPLLQRDLPGGMFGENVTLSGIVTADVAVGDRFTNGRVVLEATSPRTPCATFAAHLGEPRIVKWFAASLRTGFYCRVIREGTVEPGEKLQHQPFAGDRISIADMMSVYVNQSAERDMVRRLLASPVNEAWRGFLSELAASA